LTAERNILWLDASAKENHYCFSMEKHNGFCTVDSIIAFLWKNTTGFVLSIATMYANNDTKQRRCCFQLQQWLHERVTLSVTRTLPIFSVLMHETRMRVTKWLLGRHVVHTLHIIVVIAQQPLMGLGVIVVDVLRSYTDTPHSVGLLWTSDGPSQKPL